MFPVEEFLREAIGTEYGAVTRVKVKHIGILRHLAGVEEEEVGLPAGASVRDLLDLLAENHGPEFQDTLFEGPGKINRYLRILAGNKSICEMKSVDTRLGQDEDVALVIVVPQFAGG